MSLRVIAGLTVLTLAALGCPRTERVKRPDPVPATAEWVGGADGGAWIECKRTEVDSQLFCAIYHDRLGELIMEGRFEISGRDKSVGELGQLNYNGFDGDSIYLADGRTLVPVESRGEVP